MMERSGRPQNEDNPTKIAKKQSRKLLQNIIRNEEKEKFLKLNLEVMKLHNNNFTQLCKKLKYARGELINPVKLSHLETLNGIY